MVLIQYIIKNYLLNGILMECQTGSLSGVPILSLDQGFKKEKSFIYFMFFSSLIIYCSGDRDV